MKLTCTFKNFLVLLTLVFSTSVFSKNHLIYSVEEEVPMGFDNEITKRNYYLNIGSHQGVQKGTTLNVYRIISKLNPYDDQKRLNHKIKIGELKIVHSEEDSSIGRIATISNDIETPLFEIGNFMIGDEVGVSIN